MFAGWPDAYDVRARIAPIVLIASPVIVHAASAGILNKSVSEASVFGVCALALLTIMSQFGRDLGKQLEPQLFEKWGGAPTTQLLRHRDSRVDAETKVRVHSTLQTKIAGLSLPSRFEEAADPHAADEKYLTAVHWLRSKTADKEKFARLREENINYGFRRNLLGLKWIGVAISMALLAYLIGAVAIGGEYPGALISSPGFYVAVATLFAELLIVTRNWVRTAAFNYAHALVNAVESLP